MVRPKGPSSGLI